MVDAIVTIHRASDRVYGSPTITATLPAQGWQGNHKRVERLMRANGVVGVYKPAKVRTTIPDEENPPRPDLVGRRFAPGAPGRAWVGDITYIPTGEGWLCLASLLDLGSRKLLGYSMADHMRTELVADALDMAVGARGGDAAGTICHSDCGAQGGFDWSSQHPVNSEVSDGASSAGCGSGGACGDEVAGRAAVAA